MKEYNLTSFGSLLIYYNLITMVSNNKYLWRKVANLLNNLRRDLRYWDFVDRDIQKKEAFKYIIKALKDTIMPNEVKEALKKGISIEFGYTFEA